MKESKIKQFIKKNGKYELSNGMLRLTLITSKIDIWVETTCYNNIKRLIQDKKDELFLSMLNKLSEEI